MNEYTMQKIKGLLAAVCFLACMWVIIDGHRTVSIFGLLQMIAGLVGLLVLFYLYNASQTGKRL